jgi:L-seryl-tRNA(Ser) seleniumtransferase
MSRAGGRKRVRPRAPDREADFRSLPSVESLLQLPVLAALAQTAPRGVLLGAVRETLAARRASLKAGRRPAAAGPDALAAEARRRVEERLRPSLKPVINATGVVIHTNLGRSPLALEAVRAVTEAARSYSNLEVNLATGERGSRMAHLEPLLREVLGAPAALVVNNNAAAMLLALNTLAAGREAVVSRGQLVEIGGSFRIPEILERAGATLREVGTTNKTRLRDYERAIGPKTGTILRVHPSNFAIVGFTEEVSRRDLVVLARRRRVPLLEDVGSGALVDPARFGLSGEPLLARALAEGVPLACASGDKLLGGPQAGILAGTKRMIDSLRANPMARALRVDKLTLAALEATLRIYRDPDAASRAIPVLRMLGEPAAAVRARARRVIRGLGSDRAVIARAEVVASTAEVGGGALPLARVPSFAVALRPSRGKVDDLARALRLGADPVLGRIEADRLLLDMRTVDPGEISRMIASLVRALDEER